MIENKITSLDDREHCLALPGMYVGSTTQEQQDLFIDGVYGPQVFCTGLIKLVEETYINSLDEAIRTDFKFANKIAINMTESTATIQDNGRGLPQNIVVDKDGAELPGAVVAYTVVKAGGNFGLDDRKTAGMHGMGGSLANIFAKDFKAVTCNGENEISLHCTDNMSNIDWTQKKAKYKGTKVEFQPDFERFECTGFTEVDMAIIRNQLQTLAVVYPQIEFKFNGQKIQGNFKNYAKLYDESVLTTVTDNIQLGLARSDDGFRHLSYVNSIHTKVGGSHVDYIMDELSNELIPKIKRKYKIVVNKARIKECLTLLLFIKDMSNLRFDSQTKERLTSPAGEVKKHIDIDIGKLANTFMKNETILMPIIEAALAKQLAAEKSAQTKADNAAKKAKVAKHIKANLYGKDAETTLFLTEGDSAIGYLLSTRNQELHGGYPLRGKVLNTWGKTYPQMMANKELFDICAITGLKLGTPADNLSYKYISIFVDSDHDGLGSIYPSLLAFFSNWPELFEQGRIRLCKAPVAIATKGKEELFFYSIGEYNKARDTLKGYKVSYIKGLGTLTEDNYSRVINDPVYDTVVLPPDYKEQFEMLFGKDPDPRKEWMLNPVGERNV